jgi:hypothetical protein
VNVGGPDPADRNLIAGNGAGVSIQYNFAGAVRGNIIGAEATISYAIAAVPGERDVRLRGDGVLSVEPEYPGTEGDVPCQGAPAPVGSRRARHPGTEIVFGVLRLPPVIISAGCRSASRSWRESRAE